jgi:hypothetical protein
VWIYSYEHTVRKYTTQREIISKIDLTGFSLRHLGMEVTIVTIISLTPVVIGLSLTNIMKKL